MLFCMTAVKGNVYAAKQDFGVKVSYGFDDKVQAGCYVPFYITVANSGDNFEGTVQVIVPGPEYNTMYEKDVSLAKGAEKTIALTVPIKTNIDKVCVRLVTQKDKVAYSEVIKCNVLKSLNTVNIGVLSDDFTALTYMSGQTLLSYSDISTVIYELDETSIPEEWMALQMLDVIVISNYSTDKLTKEQVAAIGRWVDEGGLLLIGTGSTANKTLAGLNGSIMEVTVGDYNSYYTKYGLTMANLVYNYSYDNYGSSFFAKDYFQNAVTEEQEKAHEIIDGWEDDWQNYNYDEFFNRFYEANKDLLIAAYRDVYYFEYFGTALSQQDWEDYGEEEFYWYMYRNLEGLFNTRRINELNEQVSGLVGKLEYVKADVLSLSLDGHGRNFPGENMQNASENFTLVSTMNRGSGIIAVAGVDFTQTPLSSYTGNSMFFVNLIETLIGDKVIYKIKNYAPDNYWYYNDNNYYMRSVAEMAAGAAAPPVLLYIVIIGLYLIISFAMFFVLRKKKKNMLLWGWQLGMALAFSVIIYFAGLTTRKTKPELNVGVITELDNGYESVTAISAFTMPKKKNYSISFSNDYSVEQKNFNYYYGYNSRVTDYESYYLGVRTRLDSVDMEICNSEALGSEYFVLSKSGYTGRSVTADMEVVKGSLMGTVTNNYGVTLEDAFICYNGYIYAIGSIANGATAELTDENWSMQLDRYWWYRDDNPIFAKDSNGVKEVLLGNNSFANKKESMKRAFFNYARNSVMDYYNGNYYDGAILFGFPSESNDKKVQANTDNTENTFEMLYVRIASSQIKNADDFDNTVDDDYYYYYEDTTVPEPAYD